MESYTLRRADDETAQKVATVVVERFDIEAVRIRGLAEAVRASGDEDVVPDGATGYFEEEIDGEDVDSVVDALGSLTRVVIYADSPVFAWFEDGKVRFRGDEEVLDAVDEEGVSASVASETPESVVEEMTDDG
ncbi:hypothetical protein EGH25_08350 [Haladaptatus sp. F3-133]|uniref:Uncharacterized protein n=1 Tax=Halorutilus salinus TaxID=2487751 RepID=A0A9Q4C6V4_9EURY|nr:hypothetical protein [Halorutilus salinus]MCX2819361.1 hypothetical protein [Halorutilus salinus]